jgi:hypothetical protein
VIDLQLVVNGREFRSLNDVPEGLRRLVAVQLASMQLSKEQLRGRSRIVINVSKRLLREQEQRRQSGEPQEQAHTISYEQPRPAPEPKYERPLLGDDRRDDQPSWAAPARADQIGPLLGPGDPSPLSKKLLGLAAAAAAAWAFYDKFGR